jgi:hypothetical protein
MTILRSYTSDALGHQRTGGFNRPINRIDVPELTQSSIVRRNVAPRRERFGPGQDDTQPIKIDCFQKYEHHHHPIA